MKLGFPITQGSITLLPPGEIILDSFASTITAKTLLSPGLFVGYGDESLAGLMSSLELSLAGGIKASGLMSTLNLAVSGAAQMEGLLGEVTVGTSGKVLVKGLMASLGEILTELVDHILSHTHPTGTGPSGPPMPPASVQLNLLKSLKIGMSLD